MEATGMGGPRSANCCLLRGAREGSNPDVPVGASPSALLPNRTDLPARHTAVDKKENVVDVMYT